MSPRRKKEEKTKGEVTPPPPRRASWKTWFFAVSGTVVALGLVSTVYAFEYQGRFLPRTVIAGVPVGGMGEGEATLAVEAKVSTFLSQPLTLRFNDKSWQVAPQDFGTASADVTTLVADAWQQQHGGSLRHTVASLAKAPFLGSNFAIPITTLTADGAASLKQTVLSSVETPLNETTLAISGTSVSVLEGKPGQRLNRDQFKRDLNAIFIGKAADLTLALEPSSPEVTVTMAEPARARLQALLTSPLTVSFGASSAAIDVPTLASWIVTDVARDVDGVATGLTLALNKVASDAVASWSATVNKNPTNARIGIVNGKLSVVTPDVDGITLDHDGTVTALAHYLNSSDTSAKVAAVITAAKAAVRGDTLASLGITELVGTDTTDFTGSPTNRRFNIGVGQRRLDLILVKPGETFSTTGTLGPVEESTGYLPELVIKGNRTVPEAGGGLCQVSTTLFRSVLNAGLPIVERQNHAYRVGYYERDTGPGLDATVYIPSPDLKWKNDMDTSVYVQSYVKGNTITFDIYGTKDGRVSSITKPVILETYPVGNPIYVETDTLDKGVTKQIEHPHDGAKTTVTYTVTKNGQEIFNRTFISVYQAWPAQFLVGTHDPGTPPPTQ